MDQRESRRYQQTVSVRGSQDNINSRKQQQSKTMSLSTVQTNVNDIQHFLSQKNATPQTNILWAQTLRGQTDHDLFKKKIERIPNKGPRVFEEGEKSFAKLNKQNVCPSDIEFDGNIAELKQMVKDQPGYYMSKGQVDFSSGLRDYKIPKLQMKKYQQKSQQDSDYKNEKLQEKIEKSQSIRNLERNWNSLPKIDRGDFTTFHIPKCTSIKDGIHKNNQLKYAQYKEFQPQYSPMPKYNEKFGEPNSYNFQHVKSSLNSQLSWIFHLRQYKK